MCCIKLSRRCRRFHVNDGKFTDEFKSAASEWMCGVVNTNQEGVSKIITIANVLDEERMNEIMSSPEMVEWDKAHNNTDIIYSMERIN